MIKKPNDSCLRLLLGMTGLLTTSSNGRTLAHGTDSATYATVQRNKIPEEVETLTAAFDDARASLQASRAVRLCRWLRWLRLSEQNFRVDKWSLCRVRPPRGKA